MSKFTDWFHAEIQQFLAWFGVEESHVATFLKPVLQSAAQQLKKDILADIASGIPAVLAALPGGLDDALKAAKDHILPVLAVQGIELEGTVLDVIANGLIAQAQAALPPPEISGNVS